MRKVFIIGGNAWYHDLFTNIGYQVVYDIDQANLVCFTGGEDVSPHLYHHPKHPTTFNNPFRDNIEQHVFEDLLARKIPMVGICRGAQFLNVMSGGEMYQDVERHTRSHSITDLLTGETIYVSSTHHQMMKPSSEAVLVASSYLGGDREWAEGNVFKREQSYEDYEVVFYPNTRCLCFQPHPEFKAPEYEGMRAYFATLLTRYVE